MVNDLLVVGLPTNLQFVKNVISMKHNKMTDAFGWKVTYCWLNASGIWEVQRNSNYVDLIIAGQCLTLR